MSLFHRIHHTRVMIHLAQDDVARHGRKHCIFVLHVRRGVSRNIIIAQLGAFVRAASHRRAASSSSLRAPEARKNHMPPASTRIKTIYIAVTTMTRYIVCGPVPSVCIYFSWTTACTTTCALVVQQGALSCRFTRVRNIS